MFLKRDFEFAKILFSTTLLFLLFLFFAIPVLVESSTGQSPLIPLWPPAGVVINAPSSALINKPISISVWTGKAGHEIFAFCPQIDFGDGSPQKIGWCAPVGAGVGGCEVSFSHSYDSPGSYTVSAETCYCGLPRGNSDYCASTAISITINSSVCGNNIVEPGETCDDGNTISGDGCSSDCQIEASVCGNGRLEFGETCDDGNTISGDGCSSTCQIETGSSHLPQNNDLNPLGYNTFGELFDRIVGVIFFASSIIAPVMIIIAGFLMIFSGANPSNIALGRKIMLYTVVIFAIILIIKAMTYYFRGDLTFS